MSDDGLRRLNELPFDGAVAALLQCCHAHAWAEAVAAQRPYASRAALFDAADRAWLQAGASAWREAFAGHPRIGERAHAASGVTQRHWSEQEQSAAQRADAAVRAELADAQREYEQRFGHIFLVCATGRSAEEILASLRERLHNDPDTELRVAAEEQRRITRLRLEKMLTS